MYRRNFISKIFQSCVACITGFMVVNQSKSSAIGAANLGNAPVSKDSPILYFLEENGKRIFYIEVKREESDNYVRDLKKLRTINYLDIDEDTVRIGWNV
jgi:hypothetical protein